MENKEQDLNNQFGNTEQKATTHVNELINETDVNTCLNDYQAELLAKKYKRFMEIVEHDFNKDIIQFNVGDEARTFHKINQSKPLLSPSRILKLFNEHKFWRIPQANLLRPRLMGQLVHKFIELRVMFKEIVKLDLTNLAEYVGNDWETIKKNWSVEKQELFINEVNEAVSTIYNYLNLKNIQVLECEKHIANFNYHGFCDIVGLKVNNNNKYSKIPVIIDLKITSNKEITNDYILQLAIYRQIFEKTAQCYILFYNRDTKQPRLEKISWKSLDEVFNKIDTLVKMFRD